MTVKQAAGKWGISDRRVRIMRRISLAEVIKDGTMMEKIIMGKKDVHRRFAYPLKIFPGYQPGLYAGIS